MFLVNQFHNVKQVYCNENELLADVNFNKLNRLFYF